ncbi:MAG: hypothetical protein V1820_03520 [archaeon]
MIPWFLGFALSSLPPRGPEALDFPEPLELYQEEAAKFLEGYAKYYSGESGLAEISEGVVPEISEEAYRLLDSYTRFTGKGAVATARQAVWDFSILATDTLLGEIESEIAQEKGGASPGEECAPDAFADFDIFPKSPLKPLGIGRESLLCREILDAYKLLEEFAPKGPGTENARSYEEAFESREAAENFLKVEGYAIGLVFKYRIPEESETIIQAVEKYHADVLSSWSPSREIITVS